MNTVLSPKIKCVSAFFPSAPMSLLIGKLPITRAEGESTNQRPPTFYMLISHFSSLLRNPQNSSTALSSVLSPKRFHLPPLLCPVHIFAIGPTIVRDLKFQDRPRFTLQCDCKFFLGGGNFKTFGTHDREISLNSCIYQCNTICRDKNTYK